MPHDIALLCSAGDGCFGRCLLAVRLDLCGRRSPLACTWGRLHRKWDRVIEQSFREAQYPLEGAFIGGTELITTGSGTMPGVLLHVMRLCSLLVVFNAHFAVRFRVSMIGGAFVMQGTVRMGTSSITLCSASRSWAQRSTSTLCSSATGGIEEKHTL